MSHQSTASTSRRLLYAVECYLSLLTIYNPAGWPTLILALVLMPRFPVGFLICNLLFVLSLVAWVDYAWFRVLEWSAGFRALGYLCLAAGAGTLYAYLTFANNALVAAAALLLGLLLLLILRRLELWFRLEDYAPRWE